MKARVEVIGPKKAKELLVNNSGNRNLNRSTVTRYRNDMISGRWKPNGMSISFGPSGRLLNGQHRLTALIEAGETYEFVVVEEDSDDVFDTFDIGVNRATATLLHLSGIPSPAVVAAISRIVLAYRNSPAEVWHSDASGGRAAVIEWAKHNYGDTVQDAVSNVAEVRRRIPTIGTWYGGLAYLVAQDSATPKMWQDFHDGVTTGVALAERDPRLALRNWIVNRRAPHGEWDRQMALSVGIVAWNRYVANGEAQFLKFTRASLPMPDIS